MSFSSKVSSYNRQKPLQCGGNTNCPRQSQGYIYCLSALNQLLTVVRGHFGRKKQYKYLTYTTEVSQHSWSHFYCILILYIPIPSLVGSHQLLLILFSRILYFFYNIQYASAFQLCVTSIVAEVKPHSWSHFYCIPILYISITSLMGSHQLLFDLLVNNWYSLKDFLINIAFQLCVTSSTAEGSPYKLSHFDRIHCYTSHTYTQYYGVTLAP